MRVLMLPGDGIGPEIAAAALPVLLAASKSFGLNLDVEEDVVGHESLRRHGVSVRPEVIDAARRADGVILGPTAAFEYPGEINPSMFFRKTFDLYANIRPSRTYPGVKLRSGEFDLVIVRENTEGFYADRNMESGGSEMLVTRDMVISLRRITRLCCARIARAAFELASRRHKHVTAVHKANVLKLGDGLFLEECREAAKDFPGVTMDEIIVDAMMAHAVRNPQRFDVIVTTNMFGDILSDLTAELSGSLGLAGSLNAGDAYAMAQATHGTAPDIAGRNIANPFSLVLSIALLLAWHGRRKGLSAFEKAAAAMEQAVEGAIAAHDCTKDVGGQLGTREAGAALAGRLAG